MSRYRAPVVWAVVVVMPVSIGDVSFEFPGDENGQEQARELFTRMKTTRGILRQDEDRYTFGVNLIAWDKHPSHDDATGMIIGQQGWQES